MNLPSRGLLESATTMRYMGAFLRPTRRRRILTAMISPEVFRAALGSSRHRQIRCAPRGPTELPKLVAGSALQVLGGERERQRRPPNMPGGIIHLPPPGPPPPAAFFIIFCISR